jgi:hypothetical protein
MNLSRNGKWGIVAVVAVALVAAGAALAATKIHSGGQVNASGPGPALQAHGAPPRGDLSVAATYLGIDTSTLFQDLRNGKTLAQVADATSGKSAAGLIDALVAAAQSRFGGDAAQLKARITAMVNGTGFGFPGGGRGFDPDGDHGGPGGDDGGPSPSAPTTTVPPTHI